MSKKVIIISDKNKYYLNEKKYYYNLFKNAKKKNKYIRILNFYITVDFIEENEIKCHQCLYKWKEYDVRGKILTIEDEYKIKYDYCATLSGSAIIVCNCKSDKYNNYEKKEMD